jgi:hypothetical protein
MDSSTTGLLVALVGVGGTLGSAWLTQRRGDAARREEREHVERLRLADLADRRNRDAVAARRATYTALNAAARHYVACLTDHTHTLRGGSDAEPSLHAVDTARTEYRQRYAEAQMIVPDTVLTQVQTVNSCLGTAYGMLARITRGNQDEGEDLAAARRRIKETWGALAQMRAAMRTDLKVTDPSYD